MKSNRKAPKLLFQITAIVLPLFALMTAAIVWTVYNSTLKGYLEAQNGHIEEMMPEVALKFVFLDEEKPDEIKEWYLEQLKKADFDYSEDLTDEQYEKLAAFEEEPDGLTYEWYQRMPDDIRQLFLRSYFFLMTRSVSSSMENASIQSVFLMDLKSDRQGLVLFDWNKNGSSKRIGGYYDLDLSDHPVLQKALDRDTDEILFERASDFPYEGNYYLGYKPVIIGGKTRAVIGISYNWDGFRGSLNSTINKALLISIGGIAAVLTVLLIFLYRRAIQPAEKIKKAVLEYTGDKDTAKIVGNMYKITVRSELGYLSDAISDLALEIDLYTKENIRIAAERERAEKELYEAEVQVMVSQIRPHFMYNALSSIAILCKLDPNTAYEATIAFSKYLRGNMDSLKQTRPVPFEAELEHLKNYLYIEKLRFADKLNIVYDIQAAGFELPMLSVQPIVENAVKHGVGMKDEGGTVTIATRDTGEAYEIIITDDGVGFDTSAPPKDDGRSHVGMENTKKRLKDMCGADVIITSRPGEGTAARVIIPKKREDPQ